MTWGLDSRGYPSRMPGEPHCKLKGRCYCPSVASGPWVRGTPEAEPGLNLECNLCGGAAPPRG